ncbi:exported hypothetical protein [Xenorhabdus bovienii str. oregonense]|uniref:Uncharacterized protein n=1 Tax=Xenorhabdus bovienii str. oregonense TaxID=1398202 RepID=A0A077NQC5_XENBV|nr:exported hypothetical protein [Xenorhabdus bovienii str. oregonense]
MKNAHAQTVLSAIVVLLASNLAVSIFTERIAHLESSLTLKHGVLLGWLNWSNYGCSIKMDVRILFLMPLF